MGITVTQDAQGNPTWTEPNDALVNQFVAPTGIRGSGGALTDGATVNWNTADGDFFHFDMSDAHTLANPSGVPSNGQKFTFRVKNTNVGNKSLTLGNKFDVGAFSLSAIVAGKYDYYEFIYNSESAKYDLINYVKGY